MRWQHRLMVGLAVVLTGAAMATTGKLANGTGNLSKARREALIGKIEAIKQFLQDSQDPNAEQLLAYTRELSQEVRAKKFGLVFEEHRERVDVVLEENLPIVRAEATRFLDHGGELNFLIEGENLAALKLLAKTHRGKVDVIYIDPPYNTGNKDFMYNDCYIDAADLFRHSKWISFMEKRLREAKGLLSEQGVIYISIDDCELATLRLLCDEIFGEKNFVGHLTWESTTQPTNAGKAKFELQQKVESILCFAKSKAQKPPFVIPQLRPKLKYPHQGKFGKCRFEIIEKSDVGTYKRESMKYAILGQYPREGKRWQIGEDVARELERQGKVEVVDGIVKRAVYPEDEVDKYTYQPYWSHLSAKAVGTAQTGKEELKSIFGRNIGFDTVKPTALIIELLSHSRPDALVLDFFAGSGTTGHAVMKLNAADGGKRRFILVTNNENGICERVTYERLRCVMEKEGYAARLKYLKVDYVPIKERLYYEYANELLGAIRELVELENGIDFAREQGVAIVQTDEELAALVADEARLAACRKLYKGHEVLMGNKQKAALRRAGIEVLEIPQYYYPELED